MHHAARPLTAEALGQLVRRPENQFVKQAFSRCSEGACNGALDRIEGTPRGSARHHPPLRWCSEIFSDYSPSSLRECRIVNEGVQPSAPSGAGAAGAGDATPPASRRAKDTGERQQDAPPTQRVVRVPAGSAGAPKASGGTVDQEAASSMAAGRGKGGEGKSLAVKTNPGKSGKEEDECAICHAGLESDCLATVCAHR